MSRVYRIVSERGFQHHSYEIWSHVDLKNMKGEDKGIEKVSAHSNDVETAEERWNRENTRAVTRCEEEEIGGGGEKKRRLGSLEELWGNR